MDEDQSAKCFSILASEAGVEKGVMKNIKKSVMKDVTRGVKEDVTRGVKEDVTRGVKEDVTRGVKEDVTRGVKEDVTRGVKEGNQSSDHTNVNLYHCLPTVHLQITLNNVRLLSPS